MLSYRHCCVPRRKSSHKGFAFPFAPIMLRVSIDFVIHMVIKSHARLNPGRSSLDHDP